MNPAPDRKRMRRTALISAAIVAGMVGMSFAAVPLYRAFCKATGYGGTTQTAVQAPNRVLAQQVAVRFDTNVAPGVPIEFAPVQREERLHIGETAVAFFRVHNTSNAPLVVRATYNVTPETAGQYFAKLECFCFQDRTLAPGESAQLPVVYFVDPEIVSDPETNHINELTLSYTYFRSRAPGAPGAVPAS